MSNNTMSTERAPPGPCEYFNFYECHLAVLLWKIFAPLFLVVGVGGNLLSIAVLSRKRMRNSTTSLYLRFLAVVDTLVLIIGNLRELVYYATNLDVRELSDATCRIHYWLTLNVTALSGWLLAVLTIDRLVSIKRPLWAKSNCSQKTALVVSLTVTAVMFMVNSHILGYLYRTEIQVPANNTTVVLDIQCLPNTLQYMKFWQKIWPVMILILYSFIPLGCLIICNIIIANELIKRNTVLPGARHTSVYSSNQRKEFKSVTRMLIVVCSVFTAISLPTCIFLIVESYIFVGTSARDISKRRLAWAVVSILMYSNNAINFILYCLSGSLFRKELKSMFWRMKTSIMKCMNRRVVPQSDLPTGNSVNSDGQKSSSVYVLQSTSFTIKTDGNQTFSARRKSEF